MFLGNQNAVRGRGGFINTARESYPRQMTQPPQPQQQPQPQQHSVSHYSQPSHYSNVNEAPQRYTPVVPAQSGPSYNVDDSMCYDPLRATMTSWTPRFTEPPNWDTSYPSRSPPRETRPDPYQYRGSIPTPMSNFDNSRYYSHNNSYESQPPLRSILKSRSNEEFEPKREQNYSSCRELAPAPDLKDADEEDSFLYGNGSDSRDKVTPSRPMPQKPQPTTMEAILPHSFPPPEKVRPPSPSPPTPPPPPPFPPPPPPKEEDSNSERFISHTYNSHTPPPPQYNKPPEPVHNNVPVSISQLPRIPKIVSQKSANSDGCSEEKNESEEQTENDEKAEEIHKLTQEREKLSQQLISLKALLEKTIKKEADLLRNRTQKTGSRDPHVIENQKLMADVRKRIETVHDKHTDVSKRISRLRGESQKEEISAEPEQTSSNTPSFAVSNRKVEDDDEEEEDSRFVYFDAGNHLCEHCDEIVPKIQPYFEHLHTKEHWKKFSGEDEPWKPKNQKPKQPPPSDSITTAIKGSQFLIPVKGFYCSLCSVFMGNGNHAEDHLKTARHNRSYVRYTLIHPQYEHKHNSDKGKALSRKQQEERKRQKEEQDKEEREKEKQRRKQEEETRRKEKAERLREERRRKDDDRKESQKEKDKQRERDRDRERERDRDRRRALDSSPESSPARTRDPSPEVYGPHFPFKDPKLVMRTIVNISERDYRRAYKANLKAILKQNKRQKVENAASTATTAKITTTTITPVFDDEECDIDAVDLLAEINRKCDDFDAMKQEEDYGLINEGKEEKCVASEEQNEDSPPKSEEPNEDSPPKNEDNGEDDLNFEINTNSSQIKSTTVQNKGLVVMKQIFFDEDFMDVSKQTEDANNIAGPIDMSDNEEQPVVNNVMFPTLDLNDLTKSPPYTSNFNTSDDMLNHMDYS